MTDHPHYYNEIDEYAAQWIENLIAAKQIPDGVVDRRSIVDVQPCDLAPFTQCHFFAGIAGWALAARIARWPIERQLWSGSAPCQPFSVAGMQLGNDDERHLWPHYYRLVAAARPDDVVGEQVAAAIGKDWIDGVFADLESVGYACGAVVVPACAVNAPHRRDRIFFLASRSGAVDHRISTRLEGYGWDDGATRRWQESHRPVATPGSSGNVANANNVDAERGARAWAVPRASGIAGTHRELDGSSLSLPWHNAGWVIGHDGKARRVESGIRLLAHGVPSRVGRLRAYGNAIVPQIAAEALSAWMECRP